MSLYDEAYGPPDPHAHAARPPERIIEEQVGRYHTRPPQTAGTLAVDAERQRGVCRVYRAWKRTANERIVNRLDDPHHWSVGLHVEDLGGPTPIAVMYGDGSIAAPRRIVEKLCAELGRPLDPEIPGRRFISERVHW